MCVSKDVYLLVGLIPNPMDLSNTQTLVQVSASQAVIGTWNDLLLI